MAESQFYTSSVRLCQREVAALNEYLHNIPKPEVERQKPAVVDLRDLKFDERRALSNGFPWLLREQIPVFKYLSCPAPLSFSPHAATLGFGVPT